VTSQHADAAGLRLLVVGASSGIGHAVAVSAAERGAKVAVAARRMELLSQLTDTIGGSAFELDVEDSAAITGVVDAAAEALGGLDAVVFTSTVIPFAHIEDTDVTTWIHAFSVNALGANNVLRAALPHLSENGVVLVASSFDVGRPRAGVAAYSASEARSRRELELVAQRTPALVRRARRPRPATPVVQVMVGSRSASRADVSPPGRRQYAGVAGHPGVRESDRRSGGRPTGSAHQEVQPRAIQPRLTTPNDVWVGPQRASSQPSGDWPAMAPAAIPVRMKAGW
jgi:hypothetical protein